MDYDFINQEKKLLSKKNIIAFLLLAIIVVAIPVGIKLVQTQQTIKSQAAGEPIVFPDLNRTDPTTGNPVSQGSTIKVQLNSPFGPPTPETQTQ